MQNARTLCVFRCLFSLFRSLLFRKIRLTLLQKIRQQFNQSVNRCGGWFGDREHTHIFAADDKECNRRNLNSRAYAAAGSDARMNGCAMPVVINSGSGNQGITVSMPVLVYAMEYKIPEDKMLRALALSNLISLHEKRYIGSLSAYCGATSAATGAACGIAYMLGGSYEDVCGIITNTINTTGGMVCDGAKSSCASKIATAVGMALLAMNMSEKGRVFKPGEGLVEDNVEETIESVGRMGREGMKSTDVEILKIMLGK